MGEESTENQPRTENENAEVDEQAEDKLPENQLSVEDAGTLKKKLTVTVPRERIDAKREEMFGELSNSAQVPGFRIGRAPRRLLEKRFGKEVAEDVRNAVLGESIGQALEKSELKAIGEPDIDIEKIELPDSGDLSFSFDVEVAPEFDLPELKGIKVDKPILEATDERVDEELNNFVQSRGRLEETDEPAAEDDVIAAGAKITIEGEEEALDRPGLTLRVAPGQIEGLPLVDLGKVLAGKKAGETAEVNISVPEAHPNEQWRGKQATIEIQVSQVRRHVLPEIDDEFASSAGFDSLQELREAVRDRLAIRLNLETQRAMRQKIQQYLLDNIEFDLPEGLAQRQATKAAQRRYVQLMELGMPRERIDEQLTELQAAAAEQVRRDLRLQFILDKVAEVHEISVSDDELNSRIAQMASMYNRRPERVRQELASDGALEQLRAVIREEKAVDKLLEDAEITEVKPEAEQEDQAQPKAKEAARKTAKKTSKKTAKKAQKKTVKKAKKDDGGQ